jgi:hypothetical protein
LDLISPGGHRPSQAGLVQTWVRALTDNVRGCRQRGKRVGIAEFGGSSDGDGVRERGMEESLKLLLALPVEGWGPGTGGAIRQGRETSSGSPSTATTLGGDAAGRPRPACYLLPCGGPDREEEPYLVARKLASYLGQDRGQLQWCSPWHSEW